MGIPARSVQDPEGRHAIGMKALDRKVKKVKFMAGSAPDYAESCEHHKGIRGCFEEPGQMERAGGPWRRWPRKADSHFNALVLRVSGELTSGLENFPLKHSIESLGASEEALRALGDIP